MVKYRDSDSLYVGFKEQSYCTLRAQLLMALHDDNIPVAARDKCHELAWTLDAGIMQGRLTEKHLQKLEKYFEQVVVAERQERKGGWVGGWAGRPWWRRGRRGKVCERCSVWVGEGDCCTVACFGTWTDAGPSVASFSVPYF